MPGFSEKVLRFLRHVFQLHDAQIETLYVMLYFCVAPAHRSQTRRQQFLEKHPSGHLGKDEFFNLYGAQYRRSVSDHLFDLIDTNKDRSIDMNEWVIAKNILEAGSQRERLRCACPLTV
jgi:hypothetical protein